jgi:flagella basal body P-ring formation protein FlgA
LERSEHSSDNADVASEQVWKNPIAAAARRCVVEQLPWPLENVSIRLAHPVPEVATSLAAADGAKLDAAIRTNLPPLGLVQVVVNVSRSDGSVSSIPVVLDVRRFDGVVLARTVIHRGQVLTERDVAIERREVNQLDGYLTSLQDVLGRSATRTIVPSQIVKNSDITVPVGQPSSVAIKRGDKVTLVARTAGRLVVTVAGEAMQDGREGDRINVRNADSKKIVVGRVVGRDKVEVSL